MMLPCGSSWVSSLSDNFPNHGLGEAHEKNQGSESSWAFCARTADQTAPITEGLDVEERPSLNLT